MKKTIALCVAFVLLSISLAGCGGIDKRIYGKWIDDTGNNGYGFGQDAKGYAVYMGFTLPIAYYMSKDTLIVSFGEDIDPKKDPEALVYGIVFFGDDEFSLEYPVDSGSATKYVRDNTQQ